MSATNVFIQEALVQVSGSAEKLLGNLKLAPGTCTTTAAAAAVSLGILGLRVDANTAGGRRRGCLGSLVLGGKNHALGKLDAQRLVPLTELGS